MLKPLHNRVLIALDGAEETTPGGIIIPQTAQEEVPIQGTVLAVGPGEWVDGKLKPVSVEPGQFVWFGRYSGSKVEHEGKEYLLVKDSDILAVIER